MRGEDAGYVSGGQIAKGLKAGPKILGSWKEALFGVFPPKGLLEMG